MYVIAVYSSRHKKYYPYILRPLSMGSGMEDYARTFFFNRRDAINEAKKYGPPCKAQVWTYKYKARSKNLAQPTIVFK